MAKQTSKMICPQCGAEMNHHADKLVHPVTAEDARNVNEIGGLIEETHCCPACGAVESRWQ